MEKEQLLRSQSNIQIKMILFSWAYKKYVDEWVYTCAYMHRHRHVNGIFLKGILIINNSISGKYNMETRMGS
jgi:hypothetical protein